MTVNILARAMTEKELARNVIDAAKKLGWRVYHTWNSLHSPAGFPDLVLVRNGRLIFAELKREGKDPTDAQREWLEALRNIAFSVQAYVWRPADWLSGEIVELLK